MIKFEVYSLPLAWGYSIDAYGLGVYKRITAATHGVHNYRPGTHLYTWFETLICLSTLPNSADLYNGRERT